MTPLIALVINWKDVVPPITDVRCPFSYSCYTLLNPLRSRIPEHSFDVHVLRTVKRDLIALLTQIQASLPRPSEPINQVIYILNQTFNDVEQCYLVWRHERVQTTLQHGIFHPFLWVLIR